MITEGVLYFFEELNLKLQREAEGALWDDAPKACLQLGAHMVNDFKEGGLAIGKILPP